MRPGELVQRCRELGCSDVNTTVTSPDGIKTRGYRVGGLPTGGGALGLAEAAVRGELKDCTGLIAHVYSPAPAPCVFADHADAGGRGGG